MSGTTAGIVIFCVVIMLSLAIWLGVVALAARRPYSQNPSGNVCGGSCRAAGT